MSRDSASRFTLEKNFRAFKMLRGRSLLHKGRNASTSFFSPFQIWCQRAFDYAKRCWIQEWFSMITSVFRIVCQRRFHVGLLSVCVNQRSAQFLYLSRQNGVLLSCSQRRQCRYVLTFPGCLFPSKRDDEGFCVRVQNQEGTSQTAKNLIVEDLGHRPV